MDAVGALRARVSLKSPTRAEDDLGGATLNWTDQGSAWAEIAARGASETADYDTAVSIGSYLITLRRRDVRPGWRVVWGARTFRVIGVRDDGGARLELDCEEESL